MKKISTTSSSHPPIPEIQKLIVSSKKLGNDTKELLKNVKQGDQRKFTTSIANVQAEYEKITDFIADIEIEYSAWWR